MAELQGVLLCSGTGTRMTSLSDSQPKCLLPVVGMPMFLYPLASILRAGVVDVKILVRDNVQKNLEGALQTSKLLGEYPKAKVDYVKVNREYEEYGTADLVRHYFGKSKRDLLIVSGDYVSDGSLIPLIDFFRAYNASLVALVSKNAANGPTPGEKKKKVKASDYVAIEESTFRLAYLCAEEDFEEEVETEKWTEKFPRLSLTAKVTDCHVYLIRHTALPKLVHNKDLTSFKADFVPFLIEEQYKESSDITCYAFPQLHENGAVVARANTLAAFHEGNKAMLKSYERIWSTRGRGKVINSKASFPVGEYRIDETSVIGESLTIKRSIIDGSCEVGDKVTIKESIIFKEVVIGNGATITDSIICEGAEIGENANLTSCIVAAKQKVPAKTKLQHEVVEEEEEWKA